MTFPLRISPYLQRLFSICLPIFILIFSFTTASAKDTPVAVKSPIIVGGEIDYPPYSFLDSNGEPTGFQIDLVRAIARVMGMEIDIQLTTWKEARKALEAGEIDLISGMFYSEERAKIYDFSPPYSVLSSVIFARKDSPPVTSIDDLKGKEIILMRGEAMHDYVVKHNLSDRLILSDTPADALRKLASGKGEYGLGAQMPGFYWIKELGLSNLTTVGQPIEPFKNCFAVRKNNTLLLSKFSEGLSILNQTGEFQEIYEEWLGVLEPPSVSISEVLQYSAVVILPLLFLIAVSFFWSWSLRKKVAERTADLNNEIILHKEAEEALQDQRSRLANIIRSTNVATWEWNVQSGDHIIDKRWAEIIGCTLEELEPVSIKTWQMHVHPDDLKKCNELLELHFAEKLSYYDCEYRMRHKDGHWVWVQDRGQVITRTPEGKPLVMYGTLSDITEKKQAEQDLKRSETTYREIFNAINDALFIHDIHTGDIVDVNSSMLDMFGYTKEDIPGLCVGDLSSGVSPYTQEHAAELIKRAAAGESLVFEWHNRQKSGHLFFSENILKHVVIAGQERIMAIVRDITDRKQAEEQRLEMERQLLHSQKLESLGVLAGGIAHDFNNLLLAIIGNLDLSLLEISPVSAARSRIEQAMKASQKAADLTRQMLAYSGRGHFIIKDININELITENISIFNSAVSKKVNFHLNLSENIDTIPADTAQIQQIIMNLITNASEAIGDHSGDVTLETGVVACDETYFKNSFLQEKPAPGRYVFLKVTDTGCGMDEETQQKIFEPFFSTKFTGRGLGMAGVIGIIRGHKGAVFVDSHPGKGTAIKVLFPVSQNRKDQQIRKPVSSNTGTAPRDASVKTVLIVDDEPFVLDMCNDMVTTFGYQTLTAENGLAAVELFKQRSDTTIDCVILDLSMPKMGGYETFLELKRIHPDVKIILSSGYEKSEATERFQGQGLAGFVQKPYQIKTLKDELERVLFDS